MLKSERLVIMITPDEKTALKKRCEEIGVRFTKAVREAAMTLTNTTAAMAEELLESYRQNYKQLEKAAGMVKAEEELYKKLKDRWLDLKGQNEAMKIGIKQQDNIKKTGKIGTMIHAVKI